MCFFLLFLFPFLSFFFLFFVSFFIFFLSWVVSPNLISGLSRWCSPSSTQLITLDPSDCPAPLPTLFLAMLSRRGIKLLWWTNRSSRHHLFCVDRSIHSESSDTNFCIPANLVQKMYSILFLSVWSEGRVGFCSKRTCVFSGIQFTQHVIEFVVVETKQIVSSNSNVILTRQTCGQYSGMAAATKRWALAFYFPVQICYKFLISKCRGESDLSLCMSSVLAKRMPLRSAYFRLLKVFGCKIRQKSALRSGILFASTKAMHRPRSDSPLHFDIRNI